MEPSKEELASFTDIFEAIQWCRLPGDVLDQSSIAGSLLDHFGADATDHLRVLALPHKDYSESLCGWKIPDWTSPNGSRKPRLAEWAKAELLGRVARAAVAEKEPATRVDIGCGVQDIVHDCQGSKRQAPELMKKENKSHRLASSSRQHNVAPTGMMLTNRRGVPLCDMFQTGECVATDSYAHCVAFPNKAHQCEICLQPGHGSSWPEPCRNPPARDVTQKKTSYRGNASRSS